MRNEIRYALRSLVRDRGFAATVVLSLALGMGANTAIFSLIDGILLRPPEYRDPERLVSIGNLIPKFAKQYPLIPVNIASYMDWRQKLTTVESIGIARDRLFNLTGAGQPEQLSGEVISANLLAVYGAQPKLGRAFTTEEEKDGNDRVAIIADSLWRRHF